MVDPVAALLAGFAAFSSGVAPLPPAPAAPAPAPAPPAVQRPVESHHIVSPLPQGVQRIADAGRISGIVSGKLTAVGDPAVEIITDPAPGVGQRPTRGFDGCNGFSGSLIVTAQGAVIIGNPQRGNTPCADPVANEFWRVLGGQTVMFVGADNTIFLTNGIESIAFHKTA